MNDGFNNEKELKDYINDNTYNQYNNNIKNFLNFLFGENLNPNLPFIAQKEEGQIKPDLCIIHNNIKKYISIKKGSGNSVHQEKIEIFFPYIKKIFNNDTLNKLKKFHYGDDTINDTGIYRYNANECKQRYNPEIKILNTLFNKKTYLIQFINRFLFIGNISNISVDTIYYGTTTSGTWASKQEIIKYICSNIFSSDTIHFGPLTYQVWGRNHKRTAKNPNRRYTMQIKWSSILKDLQYIRKGNT